MPFCPVLAAAFWGLAELSAVIRAARFAPTLALSTFAVTLMNYIGIGALVVFLLLLFVVTRFNLDR